MNMLSSRSSITVPEENPLFLFICCGKPATEQIKTYDSFSSKSKKILLFLCHKKHWIVITNEPDHILYFKDILNKTNDDN